VIVAHHVFDLVAGGRILESQGIFAARLGDFSTGDSSNILLFYRTAHERPLEPGVIVY
jgi:hypothetical protein